MNDDERLRLIADRIVEVLRGVVREFEITEDELHRAGAFLNRVGADGLFQSLLDIAFAMTSIDTTRSQPGATRRNLEGPMYIPGAPERPDGSLLEHEPSDAARFLTLRGRVTEADTGVPVAGAAVDIWQPDEHGLYDREGWHLRGVVRTDANGEYEVRTIVPDDYAQHEDDVIGELLRRLGMSNYRAAHIHIKVHVDGEERLTTQIFNGSSKYLDADYVVGAVSDDLTVTLEPVPGEDGPEEFAATFDIALPRSARAVRA